MKISRTHIAAVVGMGGSIGVASTAGAGTEVTIRVPADVAVARAA